MHDDELNEWGLAFVNQLDEEVLTNEYIKEHWMEGDFEHCVEWIKQKHPEVTEEQLEWVEQFLSEI